MFKSAQYKLYEYMDDMSTPISALNGPPPQNNEQQVLDYNEILRTLHSDTSQQQTNMQQPPPMNMQQPQMNTQQPQQMPQQQFIPPPIVQSQRPMPYVMQPLQHTAPPKQQTYDNISEMQKDLLIIFVICLILFSDQVHTGLYKVLPSLFVKYDSFVKPSTLGSAFFSVIFVVLFYVGKKIKFN